MMEKYRLKFGTFDDQNIYLFLKFSMYFKSILCHGNSIKKLEMHMIAVDSIVLF